MSFVDVVYCGEQKRRSSTTMNVSDVRQQREYASKYRHKQCVIETLTMGRWPATP
jgi:collagenase-like PrtC family protease